MLALKSVPCAKNEFWCLLALVRRLSLKALHHQTLPSQSISPRMWTAYPMAVVKRVPRRGASTLETQNMTTLLKKRMMSSHPRRLTPHRPNLAARELQRHDPDPEQGSTIRIEMLLRMTVKTCHETSENQVQKAEVLMESSWKLAQAVTGMLWKACQVRIRMLHNNRLRCPETLASTQVLRSPLQNQTQSCLDTSCCATI